MNRRTNFRYPTAIAATRSMPRTGRHVMAGLVMLTSFSMLVSPLLSLGLVGLMLWQVWQPD